MKKLQKKTVTKSGRGKPGERKPLRLLLVDDQYILLDVLRRQFEQDPSFKMVATADCLSAACKAVDEYRPDVVLLDIELGSESGLDAICKMRESRPQMRIIMVSMYDQEVYRDRAFELGADAFVAKGAAFETLRSVMLSQTPEIKQAGNDRYWLRPAGGGGVRLTLTARELQVVKSLAEGCREKDVADKLCISVSSVGTYLKRAMYKAGVRTRAELFRLAGALGVEKG